MNGKQVLTVAAMALWLVVSGPACSDNDTDERDDRGGRPGTLKPRLGPWAARKARAVTAARINELTDGARQYKMDTKYYPGQTTESWGSGTDGQLTGSQVFTRAMFTHKGNFPASNYASYRREDLISADGREHVMSDRWPDDPMPICYYPSRVNMSGLAQFVEADNAAHTDAHKGGDFHKFIRDTRFGTSNLPHNDGEFLLIAPGLDRKYFTDDDIVNFNR